MRKLILLLLFVYISPMQAQINELGVFVGGSNYIGDIGATNYVRPNDFALGFLYKWNKSKRHSYRLSVTHSRINGDDADADSNGRVLRDFSFKNTVTEAGAFFEFNFFEFDLHELKPQFTPYVYTGLSYSLFKNSYIENGNQVEDGNDSTLGIPMAIGFKTNVFPDLILGAEIGFRYTFTDNLDGSNPSNSNLEPYRFGNMNSNDWYVFTGLTLTYTFTEKPCFCSE